MAVQTRELQMVLYEWVMRRGAPLRMKKCSTLLERIMSEIGQILAL